jgi:hypothetical protein
MRGDKEFSGGELALVPEVGDGCWGGVWLVLEGALVMGEALGEGVDFSVNTLFSISFDAF